MVSEVLETAWLVTCQRVTCHPGLSRVEGFPRIQILGYTASEDEWLTLCPIESMGSQPIGWELCALLISMAMQSGQDRMVAVFTGRAAELTSPFVK